VKLIFDTSVWIAHLRSGALDEIMPSLRGRFWLWFDSVAVAELLAGARSKSERDVVTKLIRPFEKGGRIAHPEPGDFRRAGLALGRLRQRGRTLTNPGGALLDGLIGAVCARTGALLVMANLRDFESLAEELPFRVKTLEALRLDCLTTP
jgi:predicted nucleic acid-binding protein